MEKVGQYKRANRLARYIDVTKSIEPLECLEAYNWRKMNIDKILEMMKKTPLIVDREKKEKTPGVVKEVEKESTSGKEVEKPENTTITENPSSPPPTTTTVKTETINVKEEKGLDEILEKGGDEKKDEIVVKKEEVKTEVKPKPKLIISEETLKIIEKYKSKLPVIPSLPFQYEKLDTNLLSTLKINYDVNCKNITESLQQALSTRSESEAAKDIFYKVLLNFKSDMNKYIIQLCHVYINIFYSFYIYSFYIYSFYYVYSIVNQLQVVMHLVKQIFSKFYIS